MWLTRTTTKELPNSNGGKADVKPLRCDEALKELIEEAAFCVCFEMIL